MGIDQTAFDRTAMWMREVSATVNREMMATTITMHGPVTVTIRPVPGIHELLQSPTTGMVQGSIPWLEINTPTKQ